MFVTAPAIAVSVSGILAFQFLDSSIVDAIEGLFLLGELIVPIFWIPLAFLLIIDRERFNGRDPEIRASLIVFLSITIPSVIIYVFFVFFSILMISGL